MTEPGFPGGTGGNTPVEEAFARLKVLTQADAEPVLADDEVQAALDASKVADKDGNTPISSSWTPTYLLNRAAARLWELKASKATLYVSVESDGTNINSEQVFQHCMTMAREFRKRNAFTLSKR